MTAALLERERPPVRGRGAAQSSAAAHRAAPSSRAATPRNSVPQSAEPRPGRPKLKVLDHRAVRQRARRRHALLTLFIVVLLGFFAVAFVHAELVADQQELDGVRSRIAEADARNAKVARAVEEASSPKAIVGHATEELGMVRAHQPVYLAAAAPVRDMPTSISFSGRPDTGPAFAVAAIATEVGIKTGISGTALVKREPEVTPQVDVAAPVTEPISDSAGETSQTIVQTPAIQVSVGQQQSIGGTSVSVGSTPTETGQALAGTETGVAAAPQVAAVVVQQPQSSIAGTRAVSAGQQQQAGGQVTATGSQNGTSNQNGTSGLGGTNAGTGSG